jgi:immunoglobulin heavy chain
MQIGPISAHEFQPSPEPAGLGEEPSPGFPADPLHEKKLVLSWIFLFESRGGLVPPGESMRLPCAAPGLISCSSWRSWVCEAPRKWLEWVAQINENGSGTYYPDSMKGRFTTDNVKNTCYQHINSLRTLDTAQNYFAGGTVSEFHCEAQHKPSWNGAKGQQGHLEPPGATQTWWALSECIEFRATFLSKRKGWFPVRAWVSSRESGGFYWNWKENSRGFSN